MQLTEIMEGCDDVDDFIYRLQILKEMKAPN